MKKKPVIITSELVFLVSCGLILTIGFTRGIYIKFGFLKFQATRVFIPITLILASLIIRKILTGTFFRNFLCLLPVYREWQQFTSQHFPHGLTSTRAIRRIGIIIVLAIVGTLVLGVVHAKMISRHWLLAEYYPNMEWSGTPILTIKDPSISPGRVTQNLSRVAAQYSIQWTGTLFIPYSGNYTFATSSDDGSALYLDNQLLVDNLGLHGLQERSTRQYLSRGFHDIIVRFMQGGGAADLIVTWKRPGKPWEPLSRAVLFQTLPNWWLFFLERTLNATWLLCKIAWTCALCISALSLWQHRRRLTTAFFQTAVGQRCAALFRWLLVNEDEHPAYTLWPKQARPFPRMLLLILGGSAALYLVGIWWGLPAYTGWAHDEIIPGIVLDGIEQRFSFGWDGILTYPPLHFYLLALSYIPVYILDRFMLLNIQGLSGYTGVFLMGRLTSVIMGTGTVFMMYLCGCELFRRKRAALFSASIAAILIPWIYYCKTSNLEAPYTFWFIGSIFFYLRLMKSHRTPDYFLFMTMAVFAVCTKFQAYGFYVLLPIPMLVSHYHFLKHGDPSRRFYHAVFNRKIALTGLLACLLIPVIYNVIFNFEGILAQANAIIAFATTDTGQQYVENERTLIGELGLLKQVVGQMNFSFGWPLFLICVGGIILAIRRFKTQALLLSLLMPLISYHIFFIGMIRFSRVRYLIPSYFLLAFFGGYGIVELLGWSDLRRWRSILALGIGLSFLYTCIYASAVDVLMVKDSRYQVEAWMEKNIPHQALIGLTAFTQEQPRTLQFPNRTYLTFPSIAELQQQSPDYLIVNATIRLGDPDFYTKLEQGRLNYIKVFDYQTPSRWGGVLRDMIEKHDISTNLNKLAPRIQIFQRVA